MPILAISMIILALLWFNVTSPQFKIITIAAALVAAGLAAKAKASPNLGDASTALTAIMATVGIAFLGIIAGIMRKLSSSEGSYIARRDAFWRFTAKWGLIYVAFTAIVTALFFVIGSGFDVNQMNYEAWKASSLVIQILPFKPFVFLGMVFIYKVFIKPNFASKPKLNPPS